MSMSETAYLAYGVALDYEGAGTLKFNDPETGEPIEDTYDYDFGNGVVAMPYGHVEYPFWVLVVKDTVDRSWRGDAKTFNPKHLYLREENENLAGYILSALERYDLDRQRPDSKVGWMFFASYG